MGAIVLGYDDSPGARNALGVALALAERFGDSLTSPSASRRRGTTWATSGASMRRRSRRSAARPRAPRWSRRARAGVDAEVALVPERPSAALLTLAEEHDARFIVVGSYGEGPIRGAILGSTPHKLLHLADRPVVVVPG